MTRNKQQKIEGPLQETFEILDELHDAMGAVAEAKEKISTLFKSESDEEARLALYLLDLSIAQLDVLALIVAATIKK